MLLMVQIPTAENRAGEAVSELDQSRVQMEKAGNWSAFEDEVNETEDGKER